MVRHNDPRIQIDILELIIQPFPRCIHNIAVSVQHHLSVHQIPEQAFPVLRVNSHEIGPGTCIIIPYKRMEYCKTPLHDYCLFTAPFAMMNSGELLSISS